MEKQEDYCVLVSKILFKLTERNYIPSKNKLKEIIEKSGPKSHAYILKGLFLQIKREWVNDCLPDGSHPVMSILKTLFVTALESPLGEEIICDLIDKRSPRLEEILKPTNNLLYQISRNLQLTASQKIFMAQYITRCKSQNYKVLGLQFLKIKCENFMAHYIDTERYISKDNTRKFPDHVLQYLKNILSIARTPPCGIPLATRDIFINKLTIIFPFETVPDILLPLLYQDDINTYLAIREKKLISTIKSIGYQLTSTKKNFIAVLKKIGIVVPTPLEVATMITIMVANPQLQQIENPKESHSKTENWNIKVFYYALKELSPNLEWDAVISCLDLPSFHVPDRNGLKLLISIIKIGFNNEEFPSDHLPWDAFCCVWKNEEGQKSLIFNIFMNPDIIFTKPDLINTDFLTFECTPEFDNESTYSWTHAKLCECLLRFADEGECEVTVNKLIEYPMKNCPDVLLVSILKFKRPLTEYIKSVIIELLLIFFNHQQSPCILIYFWKQDDISLKILMLETMEKWYMGQQSLNCLARIFALVVSFNALYIILMTAKSYKFIINIAMHAFEMDFLDFEMWLLNALDVKERAFIYVLINILKKHGEISIEGYNFRKLPSETVKLAYLCLQKYFDKMNIRLTISGLLSETNTPTCFEVSLHSQNHEQLIETTTTKTIEIDCGMNMEQFVKHPNRLNEEKNIILRQFKDCSSENNLKTFSRLENKMLLNGNVIFADNTQNYLNQPSKSLLRFCGNNSLPMSGHNMYPTSLHSLNVPEELLYFIYGIDGNNGSKSRFKKLHTLIKFLRMNPANEIQLMIMDQFVDSGRSLPPNQLLHITCESVSKEPKSNSLSATLLPEIITYTNESTDDSRIQINPTNILSIQGTNPPIEGYISSTTAEKHNDIVINSRTVTVMAQHILIEPTISILQTYPDLKEFIVPIIEDAVKEWRQPCIDKSNEYTISIYEETKNHDDKLNIFNYQVARNLTTSIAMLYIRKDIRQTIVTNIIACFSAALPEDILNDVYQDILDAADTLANDNLDLVCLIIQESNIVEIHIDMFNHCLFGTCEESKLNCTKMNECYDTDLTLNYNKLTDKQTNLSFENTYGVPEENMDLPSNVFEHDYFDEGEFLSWNVDYFLSKTPNDQHLNELVIELIDLTKCISNCKNRRDAVSVSVLLTKIVEGLMKISENKYQNSPKSREIFEMYKHNQLGILRLLEDPEIYGPEGLKMAITTFLSKQIPEMWRYNLSALDCLVQHGFVDMQQYDIELSFQIIYGNYNAENFAIELVQYYFADTLTSSVPEYNLYHTIQALMTISKDRPRRMPEKLEYIFETFLLSESPFLHMGRQLLNSSLDAGFGAGMFITIDGLIDFKNLLEDWNAAIYFTSSFCKNIYNHQKRKLFVKSL